MRKRRSKPLRAIFRAGLLALLSTACALPAQSTPPPSPPANPRIQNLISSLEQVRSIFETALSPDGRRIAWVTAADGGSRIDVASTSDPSSGPARPHRLTAGSESGCVETNLAWSPDSRELAFTSDCQGYLQPDLYLSILTGSSSMRFSSPRRLTPLHGSIDAVAFSPDGKRIGFLYVERATRRAGALDAMKPASGVIGVEGLEVQRVATVDVASGDVRQITPPGLHVYEYDWAPDSGEIAYVAAPPPGEDNWWVAQLYIQALSQAAGQSIFDPNRDLSRDPSRTPGPLHAFQIAEPRWSPDGSRIAFIGGLMSDQGATGGDLYLISAHGGELRDLMPGRGSSVAWFAWLRNARSPSVSPDSQIGLVEIRGGSMRRAIINLRGQEDPNQGMAFAGEVGDGALLGALSFSRDQNSFAYIESSFTSPPEVMLTREAPAGRETLSITNLNRGLKPAWGKAESIHWRSGGFEVQGWLVYPANYDPANRYPLIVSVHGGPAAAVVPAWPSLNYSPIAFSALGYFVLMPNPRGSYGQGEAFTLANRKDFGYGDLQDILAGVDAVSARFSIDQQRIGITGWSYGGFMTMFAVTQTQRFHAAVAGPGISDWKSYYGENSIDQWMIPYFGASVYDDPAVYAKSSAINFIHNAKTPTLLVVGDRDGECPAPQSFEFWHALRAERVPTALVVYPDEGHRFVSSAHQRDVLERALDWFERYMPPSVEPAAQRGNPNSLPGNHIERSIIG